MARVSTARRTSDCIDVCRRSRGFALSCGRLTDAALTRRSILRFGVLSFKGPLAGPMVTAAWHLRGR